MLQCTNAIQKWISLARLENAMSNQSTKPISPELERAFFDAVYACRDWMLDPVREPEVYVNPDRFTRHKISAICQFIWLTKTCHYLK